MLHLHSGPSHVLMNSENSGREIKSPPSGKFQIFTELSFLLYKQLRHFLS